MIYLSKEAAGAIEEWVTFQNMTVLTVSLSSYWLSKNILTGELKSISQHSPTASCQWMQELGRKH